MAKLSVFETDRIAQYYSQWGYSRDFDEAYKTYCQSVVNPVSSKAFFLNNIVEYMVSIGAEIVPERRNMVRQKRPKIRMRK